MYAAMRGCVAVAAVLVSALALGATAATAGPVLDVQSMANTTAPPGGILDYLLTVSNIGDQATDGSPLTLQATLPAGLTATGASAYPSKSNWDCSSTPFPSSTVTCTYSNDGQNNFNGVQDPHDPGSRSSAVTIAASVDPRASGTLTSSFTVSGGGAPPASTVDPTRITPVTPGFGVDAFDAQVSSDPAGDPFTQAGGHPYSATTSILFNTITNANPLLGESWSAEPVRDITVNLPPGFVANPTATGDVKCTAVQLASGGVDAQTLCPPGSQVGVTTVFTAGPKVLGDPLPVYNLVPPAGVPAEFGFNVLGTVVTLDGALRSDGDYGLSADVNNIPEGLAIAGTTLTLWGVPSDPSHDVERSCPGQVPVWHGGPSCTTDVPARPFLRNPTSCTRTGVGLETTLSVDSWFHPGTFQTASTISHNPPAFPSPPSDWGAQQGATGCGLVPFAPTLSGSPDVAAAGMPSAFSVDLTLPQSDDPDAVGTSDLKSAVVTLPPGLRASPSIAGGLQGCSQAQINLRSDADAACPGASKIGTVTIDTPLLDNPLTGSIYLASPHDNPFGSLLAFYLVVRGPGVIVKLPAEVKPDPVTGQLTTELDNQPQLPFSNVHLAFKGGPRSPLSVPPTCGTYTTDAFLTGWARPDQPVESKSSFTVSGDGYGGPCSAPTFAPKLSAGGSSTTAGKHTSIQVELSRADTDQELSGLTVTTPKGLLAKIAGVPLCGSAQAAAGTCPVRTLVGSVLTGAGAGPDPFYLPGKVYLTGPYKGAPYGLSIVVPAIAGPFNLGTVIVRAQAQVDRHTAQLHVVSDPLPTILQGIPLQIRDVRVNIDRPNFGLNPTDCEQKEVSALVTSTQHKTVRITDRFQVGGCNKLKLTPKLVLGVGAKGHDHLHASTPFTTTLTQTPGQANLKSVFVSLPSTLNARLGVVGNACTEAQYEAGHCGKAHAGSAVAVTPLLSKPLRGSVYFVKIPGAKPGALPHLVVALRGQVSFDLIGKITIPGGIRLATNFDAIPDVPIKSFKLSLVSGAKGPLGVANNLCLAKNKKAAATVKMTGQNGIVISRSQRLVVHGCHK